MTETKQLTLPVTGMTCANCVATVERNLKKLDGVGSAVVNLSSERATVEFDPALLGMSDFIARIERAGYGIATGEADLVIRRLADDTDARRLENTLSKLDGVLEAQVNFTTEKARVRYIPTVVTQAEIRRAVFGSGFEALELGGDAEDAEAKAREHEIAEQKRLLTHWSDFHNPVVPVLDEHGLWPAANDWMEAAWPKWLMFVLATPVQFYVGWQYYVGAFKSLRNGSANMDVLIAMGSSVAYLYSVDGHAGLDLLAMFILKRRRSSSRSSAWGNFWKHVPKGAPAKPSRN